MTESVIVALIACFGTVVGSFFGVITSSRLTAYRIKQLEEKVEKHNGVIERVGKLETLTKDHAEIVARTTASEMLLKVYDEKIKVANHRLDDLENEVFPHGRN